MLADQKEKPENSGLWLYRPLLWQSRISDTTLPHTATPNGGLVRLKVTDSTGEEAEGKARFLLTDRLSLRFSVLRPPKKDWLVPMVWKNQSHRRSLMSSTAAEVRHLRPQLCKLLLHITFVFTSNIPGYSLSISKIWRCWEANFATFRQMQASCF